MEEEIPGADLGVKRHSCVKKEDAGQRDGVGDARGAVGEDDASEGQDVGYGRDYAEADRAPQLKAHYREEILGQVVDYAAGAHSPADFEQVFSRHSAADYATLAETGILDDFAQLHVVHNLEAQGLVGADGFVSAATNQIESANSHVVFGFGVGDFPGAMTKDEHQLEERQHHFFSDMLHQHARKQYDVIGALLFGVGDGAADAIGAEHDVGVGEEQPIGIRRGFRGGVHSVGFAHPARGEFFYVDDY